MKTCLRFGALMCAFLSASTISIFAQGSLTPPGAPAPTMKTLAQVEPRIIVNAANTPGDATNTFIISAPGSYYLTGNITGASGKHGISIQANDVSLDLNGFALISGGGGAFRGVNVPAAQTNFYVRNGSVRGWTDGGVRADAAVTLAEKLLLANNTGAVGLEVGNGSMIKDCVASSNATGFFAPDRTHVINCISTLNTGVGFDCTSNVTLIDCTSGRNGGTGIVVQGSCTVMRCNASRNIPNGNGINAGTGCTIADCTAGSNGSAGIAVDTGSTVRGCTARANTADGIDVNSNCQAIANTCDQNNQQNSGADAGLFTGGSGNRIEANSCTNNGNGDGFSIQGSNNLVIRNSARGNGSSNYHIFAGNRYGTIVDLTAANPTGVDGNSANSTTITFDPWANFAY